MSRSNTELSLPEHLHVVVCVPSNGEWKSVFGRSLAMMFADFNIWRPPGVKSSQLSLLCQESSMLVSNRHELVKKALKLGATHVLFLDSDMKFPKNLLRKMLMRKRPVLGANCTTRGFPVKWIAHDLEGREVDSSKKMGCQKVQHVGLAVMLLEAEVLKRLEPPLFMMEWIPEVGSYCGEDVYFCAKLQAAGQDIWIDHELSREIAHCGAMSFGYEMIELNPVVDEVALKGVQNYGEKAIANQRS